MELKFQFLVLCFVVFFKDLNQTPFWHFPEVSLEFCLWSVGLRKLDCPQAGGSRDQEQAARWTVAAWLGYTPDENEQHFQDNPPRSLTALLFLPSAPPAFLSSASSLPSPVLGEPFRVIRRPLGTGRCRLADPSRVRGVLYPHPGVVCLPSCSPLLTQSS